MELGVELSSDWTGVLWFGAIAFVLVIGAFYIRYFLSRSADPRERPADLLQDRWHPDRTLGVCAAEINLLQKRHESSSQLIQLVK